ncbi:hypothetical protein COR50_15425 [Chitinophaga caeni]|uniref:Uncharacterized protein n=1 Tax=Chitinophaga caeni TaxID=2029983 RepID=A0A291QWY0_9BACT|nr:hypothetical protein COR50_15425 [Chitinophaga caeni]
MEIGADCLKLEPILASSSFQARTPGKNNVQQKGNRVRQPQESNKWKFMLLVLRAISFSKQ